MSSEPYTEGAQGLAEKAHTGNPKWEKTNVQVDPKLPELREKLFADSLTAKERAQELLLYPQTDSYSCYCSTTQTDGVFLLLWLSAWSEAEYGRPKARLWSGLLQRQRQQQRLLAHIWADREWRWDGKFSYTVLERKREKPGDVSGCHCMICDSGVCYFLFVLQLFC